MTEQFTKPRSARFRIGFVPLLDCAPFVVAESQGLFLKYGLRVHLLRQPGWATVRDKMAMGELEGAHAVCGLAVATTYGLGCPASACETALMINTHSDGITLSKSLVEKRVTTAESVVAHARERRLAGKRPFVFGIVHPYSTHHFLLRAWLRDAGLQTGGEIEIVTVPPGLMGRNMAAGHLDGFCVGEPWNTAAVVAGEGVCVVGSAMLSPLHPEKIFLVRSAVARQRPDEHRAVVSALLEACEFCDDPRNYRRLAKVLAAPRYLNLPEGLILASLEAKHLPSLGQREGRYHRFAGEAVCRPSSDKLNWVLNHLASCGLTPQAKVAEPGSVADVFRADIYDDLVSPTRRAAVS